MNLNPIYQWVGLSSGNDAVKVPAGVEFEGPTQIPYALLELLKDLGELAGNLAKLIGLVA